MNTKTHITFVDLDETLVHTYAKILVKDADNNIVATLDNQQFNLYQLADGQRFDFAEFTSAAVFKGSMPIRDNIKRAIIDNLEHGEVAILTARGDLDDKETFLSTLNAFGIPAGHYTEANKVHVIRTGNIVGMSTAAKKVYQVRRLLAKRPDIKSISLYDDSMVNLQAMHSITEVDVKLMHVDMDIITPVAFVDF